MITTAARQTEEQSQAQGSSQGINIAPVPGVEDPQKSGPQKI
jgi:hypothetical protein